MRKSKVFYKKLVYECKENDVAIAVIVENNKIDELQFGLTPKGISGWTVVGYKDLLAAIKLATEEFNLEP